jgi:AraC-like DNA-binding protein
MVSGQMYKETHAIAPPLVDGLRGNVVLGVLADAEYELTRGVHRHPHGELFLLRSGYLKSHSAAGHWLIPAGHLCWIPPYAVHGAETDNTRGTRVHLAPRLCESLPAEPCVLMNTPLILAIVDRLAADTTPRTNLSVAEDRLMGVLRDEIERARSVPILLPMPHDSNLRGIAERWLGCPDDASGLDELCAEVGMSRRSFTRNFKAETGLSVGRWRQIARLMHGIDMLAAGKSVTETAFLLGYDSISSFVILCQRHTGMSPKILARTVAPSPRRLEGKSGTVHS